MPNPIFVTLVITSISLIILDPTASFSIYGLSGFFFPKALLRKISSVIRVS